MVLSWLTVLGDGGGDGDGSSKRKKERGRWNKDTGGDRGGDETIGRLHGSSGYPFTMPTTEEEKGLAWIYHAKAGSRNQTTLLAPSSLRRTNLPLWLTLRNQIGCQRVGSTGHPHEPLTESSPFLACLFVLERA